MENYGVGCENCEVRGDQCHSCEFIYFFTGHDLMYQVLVGVVNI
jgi:hypothetical protein